MAVAKRKVATATTPLLEKPQPWAVLVAIISHLEALAELLKTAQKELLAHDPKDKLPQVFIRLGLLLSGIGNPLGKLEESLRLLVITRFDANGGPDDVGAGLRYSVIRKSQVRPAWKDEALAQAVRVKELEQLVQEAAMVVTEPTWHERRAALAKDTPTQLVESHGDYLKLYEERVKARCLPSISTTITYSQTPHQG
jgi:hypothetical protein